ncbi:transmembrane 220 family protein [Cesiribacter sp. SM1]|uniref:transmembrane 220 family protein n=1 Tax=Cesiribacter sp. SM1 TaxID=2861196 RepID=UPI001CD269DF|nr:transmembrane 220 family protein [Cesiribacter sp. SM1]
MLWFRRIFFGIWCLLFVLFAFWQWNDPDPWLWMTLYGGAAVLCGMAARGHYPMSVLLILIVACLAGAVYMYPGGIGEWVQQELEQQDLSMKTQSMEEARESFGLLIVAIILSVAAFFGWRSRAKTKTVSGKPARV